MFNLVLKVSFNSSSMQLKSLSTSQIGLQKRIEKNSNPSTGAKIALVCLDLCCTMQCDELTMDHSTFLQVKTTAFSM